MNDNFFELVKVVREGVKVTLSYDVELQIVIDPLAYTVVSCEVVSRPEDWRKPTRSSTSLRIEDRFLKNNLIADAIEIARKLNAEASLANHVKDVGPASTSQVPIVNS